MPRQPKGRPAIYQGKDGKFHVYLPVGTKSNGATKRKHIKRDSAAGVADEIDEVTKRVKQGAGALAKIETLEQWLTHWVEVILKARLDVGSMSRNGWEDYELLCRNVIPAIGHWRINGTKRRLEPEHIEALYAHMAAPKPRGQGLSESYVLRHHRMLTTSLTLAYKRGRADRNVMDLVSKDFLKTAATKNKKVKSLPLAIACKAVGAALKDEDAARWAVGIILGPRQGEALGIRWPKVRLDPDDTDVSRTPHVLMHTQIQRFAWQHGCPDPVVCNKTRTRKSHDRRGNEVEVRFDPCRRKVCPPVYAHGCEGTCGKKLAYVCPARKVVAPCAEHTTKDGKAKPCPPLCPENCAGHARSCPDRTEGGLMEVELKTHASEAPLALGPTCAELVREHRNKQIRAGMYDQDGFVFPGAAPDKPRDPRRDWQAWTNLLQRAGVPHHRLHAARHTAGSMLSATGADLPTIRDVLRHADVAVSSGYVDTGLEHRAAAVEKVAQALMDGGLAALSSMIEGAKRVA
jgi:integrase